MHATQYSPIARVIKLLVALSKGEVFDPLPTQQEIWAARSLLQYYWRKYAKYQQFFGPIVLVQVNGLLDISTIDVADGDAVIGKYLFYDNGVT